MNLRNETKEGDEMVPGQEPEIADGVTGVWFDLPEGIYLTLLIAKTPGNDAVSRMLDGLPTNRKIIVPLVLNHQLQGMLERRGFSKKIIIPGETYEEEDNIAMIREPVL